ncbi:porin family protein [Mariniflexile jejuense]|uniref:Porin family protein n=1 Tax=Mariniflexile jejuense TaxID=1173582 RepID=A0ABW3JGB7_9FLAO
MKSVYKYLFVMFGVFLCYSQEDTLNIGDKLYKEDQIYISTTYNLLGNKPNNVSQQGFSTGIHFGFIKDMPLNTDRNIAIGVGLGYSFNSFNQNLLISKDSNDNFVYTLIDGSSYTKNKFSNQLIELPIEFRWRTSTPTEYKFWRIYTGFKLGYAVFSSSKYKGDLGAFKERNIEDFNKLQYGLTLAAGYNTWNLYLYYGLNPIFSKDATLNGNTIDANALKVGLIFYIL